MLDDTLMFCSHRIMEEIIVTHTNSFFQFSFIFPAKFFCLRDIQQFPRGAVGTGGVPQDLAFVPHDLGDEFGEGLDGEFLAGAGIDSLVAGVVVHQEHAEVGKVIYILELAQGAAVTPASDKGQVHGFLRSVGAQVQPC